jgi:hypothetical protein
VKGRLLAAAVLALLTTVSLAGMPGFSGASYVASTRATATVRAADDWTPPTVGIRSPAPTVRGAVALVADAADPASGVRDVVIQVAPAGGGWVTVCATTTSPYTCSWDTRAVGDGTWSVRAIATDRAGYATNSAVVAGVLVDNAAPTVTLQDPGSPLRGTVSFTATAADAHSGVGRVTVQSLPNGSTTWIDLCTVTVAPWSCSYDTTQLAYGTYSFRVVATDVAGNSTTSAAVPNRVVDNTVSSVSLADPGQLLSGTVTLTAPASSTAGVVSVRIQRSPAGAVTWTDVCTDTTAPYSCSWSTTLVADGSYDLRAVLVDGAGRTTVSDVVAARRVDNNPVRGIDVQAVNGGAVIGRLDTGDRMTFQYSKELNLTSVAAGWTGAPLAVTLRVRDGNLLGLGNKGDTADVLLNGAAVNLGSVSLGEDFVTTNQTAVFSATLTASVTTVGGTASTQLTLTVGALTSGSVHTATAAGTMVWTPSASASDLGGRAVPATPVTETGTADRDF